jgi:hypothetical protein
MLGARVERVAVRHILRWGSPDQIPNPIVDFLFIYFFLTAEKAIGRVARDGLCTRRHGHCMGDGLSKIGVHETVESVADPGFGQD